MNASTPQIILFNAAIATQNPGQPMAQALAIGQGHVLAAGGGLLVYRTWTMVFACLALVGIESGGASAES